MIRDFDTINLLYSTILYGSISDGLGTTRFFHLDGHLDQSCYTVKKMQTKMQNH